MDSPSKTRRAKVSPLECTPLDANPTIRFPGLIFFPVLTLFRETWPIHAPIKSIPEIISRICEISPPEILISDCRAPSANPFPNWSKILESVCEQAI